MVVAAGRGDRGALDALVAEYLPLVYNIVGRAMNGHPDVDDVVQETMLRAVRGLGELRDPAAFRSWLVAIAVRQVRDSYRERLAQPPVVESDLPVPDFTEQTIDRLGLSGQRLQAAEATRWLDGDDQPVLALWWQEASGQLTRAELAAALGLTPAHAAVRDLISVSGGVSNARSAREWAERLRAGAPNDNARSFVTRLAVEPIEVPGLTGEPDARFAEAVLARVEELMVSREIAGTKSRLQRLSPVTEPEYNRTFGDLVALEQRRKVLSERAAGAL